MEKWLMILELDGNYKFLRVKKDMLEQVRAVVSSVIDIYDQEAPPVKITDYVMERLNKVFTKQEVEETKLGVYIKRVSNIWERNH